MIEVLEFLTWTGILILFLAMLGSPLVVLGKLASSDGGLKRGVIYAGYFGLSFLAGALYGAHHGPPRDWIDVVGYTAAWLVTSLVVYPIFAWVISKTIGGATWLIILLCGRGRWAHFWRRRK